MRATAQGVSGLIVVDVESPAWMLARVANLCGGCHNCFLFHSVFQRNTLVIASSSADCAVAVDTSGSDVAASVAQAQALHGALRDAVQSQTAKLRELQQENEELMDLHNQQEDKATVLEEHVEVQEQALLAERPYSSVHTSLRLHVRVFTPASTARVRCS